MFKNILVVSIAVIFITTANAQINFEKGYFINNLGERTNCLIKNLDWKNSPTNFEYRLSETSQSEYGNLDYVKEFGIGETLKFIRRTVKMHRASNNTNTLETDRSIRYNEEKIFLKALIEGPANLYIYEDGGHRSFFYSMDDNQKVEQLVYKRFRTKRRDRLTNRVEGTNNAIGENTQYRQQILNNLECESVSKSAIGKLPYKMDPLTNLFRKYNKCKNPDYVEVKREKKGFIFNLSIRPGVNFSSVEVISSSVFNGTTFEDKTGFRAGLELEVVFPFNKNKWSLVFEPTYRNFQSTGTGSRFFNGMDSVPVEADYASIEFAVGVRHSIFLNDRSKLFITGYLLNDMEMDAKLNIPIEYTINPLSNLAIGMGYKYGNKVSLEFRYDDTRELLRYNTTKSKFDNISVILGYTFL